MISKLQSTKTKNQIKAVDIFSYKYMILLVILTFSFISIFGLSSCTEGKSIENKSVEEIYNEALELFNKDNLYDAKKFFDVIKLQYPASSYADDAQYYLAEIEYKNEKYIMSSFNFNLIKKLYPNSIFVKEAQFKSALCYYKLSPGFERDLEYTKKAITAFNEFQNLYPEDSLSKESDTYIKELRNNLAAREYKIGTLYQKLTSPKASLIYFDSIINDYDDSDYLERAYLGKIEVLVFMSKYDNAKTIIDLYKQKFPNGEFKSEVSNLEANINQNKNNNKALKN